MLIKYDVTRWLAGMTGSIMDQRTLVYVFTRVAGFLIKITNSYDRFIYIETDLSIHLNTNYTNVFGGKE